MKGFKSLAVVIVMLMLTAMGLAACGDSPTATPVPPTATVPPPATATLAAETLPTATKPASPGNSNKRPVGCGDFNHCCRLAERHGR